MTASAPATSFVAGTIPSSWADAGVVEGWNALQYSADGEPPIVGDLSAIPVPANFTLTDSLTLSGTWIGDDATDVRLVLFPGPGLTGGSVDEVLYDAPYADPWSITLSGEPPADHFSSVDGISGEVALEMPLTFRDNDGNEELNWGDDLLYFACYDDAVVALGYLPEVTELQAGYLLELSGLTPGWAALTIASIGAAPVPEADRENLELSDVCSPL